MKGSATKIERCKVQVESDLGMYCPVATIDRRNPRITRLQFRVSHVD